MRSQGVKPSTRALARGGVEQAGEHLQRGGLAGAVRAEKADDLAGLDRKADLLDGLDVVELAVEKAAHRRAEAAFAFGDLVGFGKMIYINSVVH